MGRIAYWLGGRKRILARFALANALVFLLILLAPARLLAQVDAAPSSLRFAVTTAGDALLCLLCFRGSLKIGLPRTALRSSPRARMASPSDFAGLQ